MIMTSDTETVSKKAEAVWQLNRSQSCPGTTKDSFLNAVRIWCVKPHVANRRLCGSTELWSLALKTHGEPDVLLFAFIQSLCKCFSGAHPEKDLDVFAAWLKRVLLECAKNPGSQASDLGDEGYGSLESNGSDGELDVLQFYPVDVGLANGKGVVSNAGCDDGKKLNVEFDSLTVSLRFLIPKQSEKFSKILEMTFFDNDKAVITFLPVASVASGLIEPCLASGSTGEPFESSELIYRISYESPPGEWDDRVSLCTLESPILSPHLGKELEGGSKGCRCTAAWLGDTLLRKLAAWAKEVTLNTEVTSLRLVSVERYAELYRELKLKYGQQLVEMWTESTDPRKFVYEDIGIATYLIVSCSG